MEGAFFRGGRVEALEWFERDLSESCTSTLGRRSAALNTCRHRALETHTWTYPTDLKHDSSRSTSIASAPLRIEAVLCSIHASPPLPTTFVSTHAALSTAPKLRAPSSGSVVDLVECEAREPPGPLLRRLRETFQSRNQGGESIYIQIQRSRMQRIPRWTNSLPIACLLKAFTQLEMLYIRLSTIGPCHEGTPLL